MRSLVLYLLILLTGHNLYGQDQKEVQLPSFASLKVFGPFRVYLQADEVEKAVVEAADGQLDNVLTEVRNGRLKIKFVDDIWRNERPKVVVHYKVLSEIVTEADGQIRSLDPIRTQSLRLSVSSGSQAELDVEVETLDVSVTTGAVLRLAGKARIQESQVNTGGDIDALDLDSDEVYIRAGTGGQARIRALESIEARSSMGGHITYTGNPASEDRTTSMGGTISRD